MADSSTSVGRANSDEVVRRGQEAWSRLEAGRSWEDWLAVGEAIQVGRHRAMVEANTNQPHGSRFNSIFGEWLQETGFDTLDKGDRNRLLNCLKHHAEIQAWRLSLPANKRLQLNHPNAVWRNWQKTVVGKAAGETPGQLSPIGRLKQEIVRLEDENLQLRRAGDDLFSSKDSAADITRLIADHLLQRLTPTKVREIAKLLPDVIASRAELPRNSMRSSRRRTVEDFRRDLAAKRIETAPPVASEAEITP